MPNAMWPNDSGPGEHTPSTARQSGRGAQVGDFDGLSHGSTVAHPTGGDNDPLDKKTDLFEAPGQMSVCGPPTY